MIHRDSDLFCSDLLQIFGPFARLIRGYSGTRAPIRRFAPDTTFQPFIGLGLIYTAFLSEDLDPFWSELVDGQALGILDYSLDDSFGVAAQIGANWMLSDKWLINFDVRWINIESDLSVTIDVGEGPETGELGTVKIDPWVFAINLGYSF